MTAGWQPVAARAASLLLRYPDDTVSAALPVISDALPALPPAVAEPLHAVADYRAGTDIGRQRTTYVDLFDFRRRCCLHLTYYTCGDTRRRGEALADFAATYKRAGLEIVDGELPDYLPAVLDLAAEHDSGWQLLRDNRIGLDLLTASLDKDGTVYRHAVDAVRAMLPPPAPGDLAAAARLARTGPPAEQVGLEPFGLANTSGGRR
ncbi:nitrate reductase molybdenum cofactor assembly chaperone [Actinoplanes sp. DH11]|uniref:nitrate reductase molybdenum cofactor assembly chaperone n=1 Tax=Actinoplanes sp. DH11 TaxID=2857011 RepID=UPI001E5B3646|nr:nitrate reductase molybdenum cofactor assembly chaperone [Actinoplanes sp. DH11]